jgi:hypothetical protein
LLTVSDLWLSLSLWSLKEGGQGGREGGREGGGEEAVFTVAYPKVGVKPVFSPDGCLLLVARRREGRDEVGVYGRTGREGGREGWACLRTFLPETVDLVALEWSPTGSFFIIRDTHLVEDGVIACAPDGGKVLWRMEEEGREGGGGLGVKSVAISPDGLWVAVGGWDEKLRMFSTLTWGKVLEGTCGREGAREGGKEAQRSVAGTRNITGSDAPSRDRSQRTKGFVAYTQDPEEGGVFHPCLPPSLPFLKPDSSKPAPKIGVGLLAWSGQGGGRGGGRFLLARNDAMPQVVWVWDVYALGLAGILVFADPVRSAQWSPPSPPPSPPSLCVATGGPRFYVWSLAGEEEGGEGVGEGVAGVIPPPAWFDLPVGESGNFDVTRVRWAPKEGGREGGREGGSEEAVWRGIETMRLEGRREEGGVEEGEEGAEEVSLVALMSPDRWCVCALNQ